MRANSFNYKIAASIAALIVAVPAAHYMLRRETPPILRVAQEATPLSSENKATPVTRADNLPSEEVPGNQGGNHFPDGEKTIYEPLRPDGTPTASAAGGKSLEDRIDEALKKAHRTGDVPNSGPPTVVRSESYTPDGKRVDAPPVNNGLFRPLGYEPAPTTASPLTAAPSPGSGATARASGQTEWLGSTDADSSAATAGPASGWGAAAGFSGGQPEISGYGPARRSAATPAPASKPARARAILRQGSAGIPVNPFAEATGEKHAQFEAFASNPVKQVAAEPVSTFSIDVDTASYSFVRRSLLAARMPPKDSVRVEEMINYFPYAYPRPESAAVPFQPTVTLMPSPWKPTNKLVHIGIKGYEITAKERPRANLVLLIDVSGSMAPEDRLPMLKNSFRMLLDELKPDDTVGIVTYASQSGVALESTRVAERGKIVDVLDRLIASGSTDGGTGLQDAYRLAGMNFDKNAVNRIILATDGDFNVGITDHEQLKRFIEAKRQTGIYLSVLGVGHDNYNDRLMQALAQNGNGVAAYVDTLNEARKVLVDEASSSLFPIAKDVKIQIEFNPAQVSEYRLIGYETRALMREDFNNDKVDAGDIGSGHTVTAIYEVTPVGAPKFVDDLRYQKPEAQPAAHSGTGGELGFLKIRYKLPGEEASKLVTTAITDGAEPADIHAAPEDVRFSIAVAAFGQLLRGEPYTGGFSFDDVIALAQTARGTDPFGYRAEFLNLVRLAKSARQ